MSGELPPSTYSPVAWDGTTQDHDEILRTMAELHERAAELLADIRAVPVIEEIEIASPS